MALAIARQQFTQELTDIYGDIKKPKTHADYANRMCDSIHKFIIQALPMTKISTFPAGVSGYQTQGPVKGTSIGGLDKRAPGMGLASAKKILEQDLLNAFMHGNTPHPASVQAQKIGMAIEKYMLQAIVRTKEVTKAPMPAPASSGPVQGLIDGIGGVLSDKPGIGYKAAKPRLKEMITATYAKIEKEYSHAEKARDWSEAIHTFAIEGIIKTKGTFKAGATVSSESGNGAYQPGTGQSITGTLS